MVRTKFVDIVLASTSSGRILFYSGGLVVVGVVTTSLIAVQHQLNPIAAAIILGADGLSRWRKNIAAAGMLLLLLLVLQNFCFSTGEYLVTSLV